MLKSLTRQLAFKTSRWSCGATLKYKCRCKDFTAVITTGQRQKDGCKVYGYKVYFYKVYLVNFKLCVIAGQSTMANLLFKIG